MRDLVRQHDLDFIVRVLGEHRVRHENAPRGAKTGERGVRFFRFVAEAPFVGAEDARAGAIGQREQPRAQRVFAERLHRVEQGQQQDRREVREADEDDREERAGGEPPPFG